MMIILQWNSLYFFLKSFFHKNNDEATKIMLHVHQNGVGVCGVFPYEIAETKVIQVLETAKRMIILYNVQWKRIKGMAGFAQSLEESLQRSIDYAAKNHEHVTVEHLLLALIEDIDATESS